MCVFTDQGFALKKILTKKSIRLAECQLSIWKRKNSIWNLTNHMYTAPKKTEKVRIANSQQQT